MKVLKYLLFLIAALVLIALLVGLAKPEVTYGSEIKVNKSIEESWAVSQDLDKYPLWLKGFKSMELLSGEFAEVGSTYKVIVNPGEGQEDFEMVETIISIKDNDHILMDFDSDMMDFEQRIDFSESNGVTTITTDSKVMGKGIMMRSMFAMMEMFGGSFTAQEQSNMDALKKVIEENTTSY